MNQKADKDDKDKDSRDERREKIKGLITSHSEDAAKVLKMWLQNAQEEKKRKK
jgi:flagellar biosynthesis/type III secretory pathway M-ring protein FliF/YscJ